jgi:tetrahydromethanopterin S-methyltransferase subunit A
VPNMTEQATVLVCDYVGGRPEAPVSSLNLESHGYEVRYLLTARA